MRDRNRAAAAVAAALAYAGVARGAYLLEFRHDVYWRIPIHDAARYHAWASAWASGRPFETGAFSQAPLYPWLLSLLYRIAGPSPGAAYAAQCALGVAALALVHRIASRAWGETAARWAVALGAGYGTLTFFETKLLPASLSVFLSALVIERLQAAAGGGRLREWWGAGLALGLAAAASAGSLVTAGLAVGWISLDRGLQARRRAERAAAFALGVAVVLAPLAVRNRLATGEWVLVATNGGITYWHGNNPGAVGVFATPEGFTGAVATQQDEAKAIAEAETGRTLTDGEVSAHWFRKGLREAAARPAHAAALAVRKALLAAASEEQPLEYGVRLDRNPARWLAPLPFAALVGLAASLAVARGRPGTKRRAGAALVPVWIGLASTGALLVVFYVSARYRLPAAPPLLAVAGAGAASIEGAFRRGDARRGALALLMAAAAAAASLAYFPWTHAGLRRHQEAMGLCDRGGALRADGRLDESERAYRAAATLDPDYPYAYVDLARTLKAAGKVSEAEAALRQALRVAPEIAESWIALGGIAFDGGRLEEAEAAFAEAWRLAPRDASAGNDLLGTRVRLGRVEAALGTWREMRERGLAIDAPLDAWARDHGAR